VVPFPTPEYSHGHAHYLTLDLTKTFGASLTNDLMASGVFYMQPKNFANPARLRPPEPPGRRRATMGYYHTGTQLPQSSPMKPPGFRAWDLDISGRKVNISGSST